ncbi:MAG TPA: hypothetical protein VF409_11000, partial [Sphingomonas sp.]
MNTFARAVRGASLVALTGVLASPAYASDGPAAYDSGKDDILIVAQRQQQTIENAPSTRATVDADTIARTVNA